MADLISVVIPTYNRRDKLMASVESVLAQSYENIELIVVDDASTDGTAALFETNRDPRLVFLRYEENRGACYARNFGAARSRGDYLAFQDSDDLWHKDKLEKQLAFMKQTGADLVFCGMNRVAENGSRFYYPVHAFHPARALPEMLAENRAGTQAMLMRRAVWESLRFDERFRRYQDWDFSIRAAERFQLAYLPEALIDSAVGSDSISSSVSSYPALSQLFEKHAALYQAHPESSAVMNRRMGKRLFRADPAAAAGHYWKSFCLSHTAYDLAYYLSALLRAKLKKGFRLP